MRIAAALILVILGACSPRLPAAHDTIGDKALDAPFPTLKPLSALLAEAKAGSTIEAEETALEARVARLKARASALRGRSIIDGQTRLKLLNAVAARGN